MTEQTWNDKIINGRLTEGAFAGNETLTEIEIPEGVTDIGEVAFYGCPNLRSVTLPQSLKVIREEAFGESGIERIVIPEGTARICEKAFYSCPDLARVDVLSPDTQIEADAFGMCPNLLEGYIACGYPADPCPPELNMSGSPTREILLGHTASGTETNDLLFDDSQSGATTSEPLHNHSEGDSRKRTSLIAYAGELTAYLSPPEELLYTLLWCTCPERHTAKTSARAEEFIRENENLVMEHILKTGNTAAMNGLASRKLLRPENISTYIDEAGARHESEIVALLLSAAAGAGGEDEFAL